MGGCNTYQIRKIYAIGQALGIVNRGGEERAARPCIWRDRQEQREGAELQRGVQGDWRTGSTAGARRRPAQRKPTTASESRPA